MLKKRSRRRQWRTRRINGHIKQRIWGNISLKNRPFLRGNRRRRSSHSLLHPNDVRQGVEMHLARSAHDTTIDRVGRTRIFSKVFKNFFTQTTSTTRCDQERATDGMSMHCFAYFQWICHSKFILFILAFLFVFYLKFLVSLFRFFSVRNAKNLVKSSAWDNNKQTHRGLTCL